MKSLPKFLEKYFWDVEFKEIDKNKNDRFVIGRILEYGDKKAAHWLFKNYPLNQIKEMVCKTRSLSPRSLFFWALLLNLDKRKIKCLKKSFLESRKIFWPY
jgi:hypothetical protein